MRKPKITIYLLDYIDEHDRRICEWRWHWKAANGKVIAASTEGYVKRKRAIENLAFITGGHIALTFPGPHPNSDEYAQGYLDRRALLGGGVFERIFVEVTP